MATTIEGLSTELAALKEIILKDKPPKDAQGQQPPRPVSELKKSLVDEEPRILTEALLKQHLPKDFISRFDEMHKELQKAIKSELLEALGLDTFGAAWEKYKEGHEDMEFYFLAAFGSLLVPALLTFLSAWMIQLSRAVQRIGNPDRPVATGNGNGWFQREHIDVINQREDRLFNGVAGIDALPDATLIEKARQELEKLIPKMDDFNLKAPGFRTKFNEMPGHRAVSKTAKSVLALGEAMEKVNIEDVGTLATKADDLKKAMEDFKPTKIPQDLTQTRTAAQNLGNSVAELRSTFQKLREEAARTSSALGAPAGGSGN